MDGTYPSILIVTFIVLLAAADAVVAKAVYVDPNAVGARDGSSWADAFTNIQDGIDSASPGDAVIIAPARYTGSRNRDLSLHGKALTVRSTDPSDPAVVANTIIDCSGSLTSPHRGFVFDSGEGADSVLDGLVIARGWASNVNIDGRLFAPGGAVLCVNASPTINRCMVISSRAEVGGGIAGINSSTAISDCAISHNSSYAQDGGGLAFIRGTPSVRRCTISDNEAKRNGGAIACDASSAEVTNCLVVNNGAEGRAGAIYCYDLSTEMAIGHSTFTGNTAQDAGVSIYCDQSAVRVINCLLYDSEHDPSQSIWPPVALDGDSSIAISFTGLMDYGESFFEGWGVAFMDSQGNSQVDWGSGNLDISLVDPKIRGDGRLLGDSPCIDAGDPANLYFAQVDVDGEPRQYPNRTDMGADEFRDTDGDRMPDWWELRHFQSVTGGVATADADDDGFSNRAEYELDTDPTGGASICYVDPALGSDGYDGVASAWDGVHGPKATIQEAIDAVPVAGVVIILARGIYAGNGSRDLDFKGKAITVRSTDPTSPAVVGTTVIDCQGTLSDPHRGFRFVSGEDSTSVLSGITIRNGYAPAELIDSIWNAFGGAVFCLDSSPTISYCHITQCTAYSASYFSGGGGIFCERSSPAISHCQVVENHALDGGGGGVYIAGGSSPSLSDCVISDNTAVGTSGGMGGGIFCDGETTLTLRNCAIRRNRVTENNGGGIAFAGESSAAVIQCEISGNQANGGAGIFCLTGDPLIAECVISGNVASQRGGGIYCYQSDAVLSGCDFVSNQASSVGGAIYCYSCSPSIAACNVTANVADYGAIYCHFSSPAISDSQIAGNRARQHGGGIYCMSQSSPSIVNCTVADNFEVNTMGGALAAWEQSRPIVHNAILYGNGSREVFLTNNSSLSVSYSDIEGGQGHVTIMPGCTLIWGIGNLADDPRFLARGQWDANDTPGDVLDDFWLDGDYQLRGDSPCVDGGDPGVVVDPNETDLRRRPRIVGAWIDMGAYEYEPPAWVLHDWNGDGIVSIVGDVPPFVNCVYFQNCPSGIDLIAVGDCNHDGFISIIGDVPCFVNCVYFQNCPQP